MCVRVSAPYLHSLRLCVCGCPRLRASAGKERLQQHPDLFPPNAGKPSKRATSLCSPQFTGEQCGVAPFLRAPPLIKTGIIFFGGGISNQQGQWIFYPCELAPPVRNCSGGNHSDQSGGFLFSRSDLLLVGCRIPSPPCWALSFLPSLPSFFPSTRQQVVPEVGRLGSPSPEISGCPDADPAAQQPVSCIHRQEHSREGRAEAGRLAEGRSWSSSGEALNGAAAAALTTQWHRLLQRPQHTPHLQPHLAASLPK